MVQMRYWRYSLHTAALLLLRAAVFLLSALLLLAVAGCGSGTTAPAEQTPETADETPVSSDTPDVDDESKALFAQLVEANSTAAALTRHTSKQVTAVSYLDGEEIYRFTVYMDAETYEIEDSAGYSHIVTVTDTDALHLDRYPDEPDGEVVLVESFYDSADAYQEQLSERHDFTSLSIEPEEILTSAEERDGSYYMTTELSDADWIRNRLEQDEEDWGTDNPYRDMDDVTMVYTYVFNKETTDLLAIWAVLREADGTEHVYSMDTFAYDVVFSVMESPLAPYFETSESDGATALTLVLSPGTELETELSFTLRKGIYWTIYLNGEEYMGDIYTDEACTQVYEGGIRQPELTLYIP